MIKDILISMDWSPIIETVIGFAILALAISSPISLIKKLLNKLKNF